MTWGELSEAYATAQTLRGCTPATVHKQRASLRRFLHWLQRHPDPPLPGALAPSHLAAYQSELGSGRYSPHSVRGWLTDLRSFLRWAARRGPLLVDPTADWSWPHPPAALFRLLTVAEVERLLEMPDPQTSQGLRDRALLECLYGLGLRRAECQGLNVADLDFCSQTVRVARVKGGRSRVLPLPPHLAQVLQRYLEAGRGELVQDPQSGLFLTLTGGRRLGSPQIHALVRRYARLAGLPDVTPHRLRHACASHLLEAGADVRVVQQLLGHASVTSTQIYTHLFPEAVVRTHGRTHPRGRRR